MSSYLESWITKNKFYQGELLSHLKLNGGKLYIPQNRQKQFQKLYAKDVENGFNHYLCEKKTETYKLFIDVDLLNNEALTDSEILKYSQCIQEVVLYYYSQLKPHVIICTTTPKPVESNGYNYIKTGIHLIWPDIIVSMENINWIRSAIIQYLKIKIGERPAHDNWEKVIDDSVYKQNGLRMIYSSKMAFCKTCKSQETCSLCNKTGKYHEGRPYKPYKILDENNNIIDSNYSILEVVQKTSIVSCGIISKFKKEHPQWFEIKSHEKKQFGGEDNKGYDKFKSKEKIHDSDLVKSLEIFIRKAFPHYKSVNLMDVNKVDRGEYYVCRTNSSFCLNLEREHRSNTIYFYIDKINIYQKCFCSCDTLSGRKYGKCSDFKSVGVRLNKALKKKLYPYDQDLNFNAICELNTMSFVKKDKITYINNLQNYLNYLENKIISFE